MQINKLLARFGLSVILFTLVVLFAGCGADKDDNFTGFGEAEDFHPFDEISNHGAYLKGVNYAFDKCTQCHGSDLHGLPAKLGGTIRSCYKCHNPNHHIVDFDSSSRHSSYLASHNYDFDQCWKCHTTTDLSFGGTCYKCHSSDHHIIGFDSTYQHISYMRQSKWNTNLCSHCHKVKDTDQATFGSGCEKSGCHKEPNGVFNCNVCHGDPAGSPDDTLAWAPPYALNRDTATTYMGVGAHQAHLRIPDGMWKTISCTECHVVPTQDTFADHLGTDPGVAEVTFNTLASDSGRKSPTWNRELQTCSNTYCHFDATPKWTQVDGTFNACGSCHTVPPSNPPHWPQLTREQCYFCHASVIDQNGDFVDPGLHCNGRVDH